MDSYVFDFRLTLDDWRAYRQVSARRVRRLGWRRWAAFVLAVAASVVVTAAVFHVLDVPLELAPVLAGMLFAALPLWLYLRFWAAATTPGAGSLFFEKFRYVLDAEGIHGARPDIEAHTRWSVVRSVTSTEDHLYLWIDRTQAHLIPWRKLPGEVSRADLLASVERWRGKSNDDDGSPHALPGEVPTAAPAQATGTAGRSWLSGLPRLLALRQAPGLRAAPTWLVWLLAGLALLGWTALDRLRTGPEAVFSPYNVPGIALYVLILLGAAAALSAFSKPRASLRSTLVLLLALLIVAFALAAVADAASVQNIAIRIGTLVVGIYCLIVAVQMLRSTTGRNQPRAVSSAALVLGLGWLLTRCIYVDPGLWFAPDLDEYADYSNYWDRAESLLFEQPARIDQVIAQIPADVGSPQAFFVGFAGYGEERVFAEEIKLAAEVVGERYGTSERTVLLLNDRRDLESRPLATVASLHYALEGLAARMDVNEDLLFLSLSSHGSEDYLAVSNGPLMLDALTEEALVEALDESGIKWRVIVISACYSGSFIDALDDPNTVVITAAADDRASFGCTDDRHLTYFGEAFYRDALPEAGSLREAFETAVESIAERERREDIEPSKPQAHFGQVIERKLGDFERVREKASSSTMHPIS